MLQRPRTTATPSTPSAPLSPLTPSRAARPVDLHCRQRIPTSSRRQITPPEPPNSDPGPPAHEITQPSIGPQHIGMKVIVAGRKTGILRFFGPLDWDDGDWCGVQLDEPVGLHDGKVRGVRFFSCPPRHGILSPAKNVRLIEPELVVDEAMDEDIPGVANHVQELNPAEDNPDCFTTTPPSISSIAPPSLSFLMSKQNSFELDESLGILTPDQMADFTISADGAPSVSCDLEPPSTGTPGDLASPSMDEDLPQDNAPSTSTSTATEPVEMIPAPHIIPTAPVLQSLKGPVSPTSIITSVTSIASLDTGYQGDGESSRPGSRGASTLQGIVLAPLDPMTDSDFFTESDADIHEVAVAAVKAASVAALTGPGDRKAQVIDGTLYTHPVAVAAVMQRSEDMDSSGVYSDLERKDHATDSDMDASSTQPKQVLRTFASFNEELMEVIKNMVLQPTVPEESQETSPQQSLNPSTIQPEPSKPSAQTSEPSSTADKPPPSSTRITKHKMPKRNVVSKVKMMMNQPTQPESGTQPPKPSHPPRQKKGSRWDAVMKKIEANQAEQNKLPDRLKEVKGKVFASMGISNTPRAISPRTSTPRERKTTRTGESFSRRPRPSGGSAAGSSVGTGSAAVNSPVSSSGSSLSDVSEGRRDLRTPGTASRGYSERPSVRRKPTAVSPKKKPANGGNHPIVSYRKNSSSIPVINPSTSVDNLKRGTPKPSSGRSTTSRNGVLRYAVSATSTPSSRGSPSLSNGTLSNGTLSNNGVQARSSTRVTPKGSTTDKTLPPRKPAIGIIRNGTSASRPSPLRDHNGRLGQLKPADETPPTKTTVTSITRRPGGSQRVGHASARSTPASGPAAAAAAAARTAETEAALRRAEIRATAAEAAARESGAGVVALGVVVNYLANTLEAFSSPQLKKEIDKVKKEWALTKQELEETRAEVMRLREEQQQSVQEREATTALLQTRQKETEGLRQKLEFANEDYSRKLLDLRHELEVQALAAREESTRRETEAAQAARDAAARLEALQVDLDTVTSRADREAELRRRLEGTLERREAQVRRQVEDAAARREAEDQARLQALEAENAALREQNRRVADCIKGDKDAKMQALAERCRELQDETESLRSVLELKSSEMQQLRTQNLVLHRDADQLPGALQRVATLTARVEDLELQLERKNLSESQLYQDNQILQESFAQESKLKRLLSYENEQLQWRLKNVAAFQSSGFSNGWATNTSADRSNLRSLAPGRRPHDDASPPTSPKILGVVEKSDSVSYVLDLDASDVCFAPDRRTVSTPAVEVPRNLPPPKRQCCKSLNRIRTTSNDSSSLPSTTVPKSNPLMQSASTSVIPSARETPAKKRSVSFRTRSKSISSDSGECLSSGNWSPPISLHHAAGENAVDGIEQDPLLLCASPQYTGPYGAGRQPCECSDIEDFSSSKSSSMSCSSEGSELCKSEPERNGDSKLPDDTKNDLMKSSLTLPKESGGEAMISEEVTEDEDNDGSNSCCSEDGSCCEEEDTSSSG